MLTNGAAQQATIAVIILNYNYANYLKQCISSALNQTTPFDEVIVINDGSTDDSMNVISSFGSSIRAHNKENGGQISASILGLGMAKTDYVYFLDADDYLRSDALEILIPFLDNKATKIQFQLEGVDEAGQPLGSIFPVFPAAYDAIGMIASNNQIGYYISPPTSGNVYHSKFLRSLDLASLDQRDAVDGVPNLVAPYHGPIVSIGKSLAFYRVHGKSFSQWGKPTPDLLNGEIAWLKKRWHQAKPLLPISASAVDVDKTLYAIERRLMSAALTDARILKLVGEFLFVLRRCNLPFVQKLFLIVWASAFCTPSGALRRALVIARRSPGRRPKFVNDLVLFFKKTSAYIQNLRINSNAR